MKKENDFHFSIENIVLDQVIANPNQLLQSLSEFDKLKLKDYLFDQLPDKDGAPTFENLKIQNLHYTSNAINGKFRLTFEINRTYCCSDIESSKSDYIDFDFEIHGKTIKAWTEYFVWELNN